MLETVPYEMLLDIAAYSSGIETIFKLALVNEIFYKIQQSDYFWKHYFCRSIKNDKEIKSSLVYKNSYKIMAYIARRLYFLFDKMKLKPNSMETFYYDITETIPVSLYVFRDICYKYLLLNFQTCIDMEKMLTMKIEDILLIIQLKMPIDFYCCTETEIDGHPSLMYAQNHPFVVLMKHNRHTFGIPFGAFQGSFFIPRKDFVDQFRKKGVHKSIENPF